MTMIDAIGGSKVIGNHRDHDDDLDLRKKMRMMMMRITIYLREWRVCLFVCLYPWFTSGDELVPWEENG